jgi:hypothetical protein
MGQVMRGQPIIAGEAEGEALVGHEPLSFWGGYDHRTGEVIDRRHPLSGHSAAGRILVVPASRGSSTTTAVFLEAVKANTAPAAIITLEPDTYFALASVVADELYQRPVPVIALAPDDFARLATGQHIKVSRDGTLVISNH